MIVGNLQYNAAGTIDCEYEHPVYGWIQFTADPDDTEEFGRSLYAKAVSGELGGVAAYVSPVLSLDEQTSKVHAQRLAAYRLESDPLKIEADYDAQISGTVPDYSSWIAKVQEIKARYPLPA